MDNLEHLFQTNFVSIGGTFVKNYKDKKFIGSTARYFAYIASQIKCNACFMTSIGNDEEGNAIINEIELKRNETFKYKIEKNDAPTVVVSPCSSNKQFSYNFPEIDNWNTISPTDEKIDIIKYADVVYFDALIMRSALAKNSVGKLLENTKKTAYKIFDMNLYNTTCNQQALEYALSQANVLMVNEQELLILKNKLDIQYPHHRDVCGKILRHYNLEYLICFHANEDVDIFSADRKYGQHNLLTDAFKYEIEMDNWRAAFGAVFIRCVLEKVNFEDAIRYAATLTHSFIEQNDNKIPQLIKRNSALKIIALTLGLPIFLIVLVVLYPPLKFKKLYAGIFFTLYIILLLILGAQKHKSEGDKWNKTVLFWALKDKETQSNVISAIVIFILAMIYCYIQYK